MTVLCLIEQGGDGGVADVSLRALTFARNLAASAPEPSGIAAVVFGDAAAAVPALSEYGVTDAYAVELTGYVPQAWARALAGLAAGLSATAVVAAGTDHGSEVMAHLGAFTGL